MSERFPFTGPCLLCGRHPDSRHRIVDAIWERCAAGEDPDVVLADYGLTAHEFLTLHLQVENRANHDE